jgi:hypothetical protein
VRCLCVHRITRMWLRCQRRHQLSQPRRRCRLQRIASLCCGVCVRVAAVCSAACTAGARPTTRKSTRATPRRVGAVRRHCRAQGDAVDSAVGRCGCCAVTRALRSDYPDARVVVNQCTPLFRGAVLVVPRGCSLLSAAVRRGGRGRSHHVPADVAQTPRAATPACRAPASRMHSSTARRRRRCGTPDSAASR